MKSFRPLFSNAAACLLGAALFLPLSLSADNATVKAAAAAKAFLKTLSESQRSKAVFGYANREQRANWSNLPTGIYQRAGIRMGDLTPAQREAAMAVLAASLSPRGYQKVLEIVAGDEVLKAEGGPGGLKFGADEFYISFLGAPSETDPWMWQFGGHHLAINATLAGSAGVLTPSLTAAQPATYQLHGKTVRPLGRENDLAFALINALNEEQRGHAILKYRVANLVLGPGRDGKKIAPEGLKGSMLTEAQKGMLMDLIREWVAIDNEANAAAKMSEIQDHLNDTWFAWNGPLENGSAVYFRIQGPTLVIEYAPQKLGGNPVNHIHTIYRDPTNDYGVKFGGQK